MADRAVQPRKAAGDSGLAKRGAAEPEPGLRAGRAFFEPSGREDEPGRVRDGLSERFLAPERADDLPEDEPPGLAAPEAARPPPSLAESFPEPGCRGAAPSGPAARERSERARGASGPGVRERDAEDSGPCPRDRSERDEAGSEPDERDADGPATGMS